MTRQAHWLIPALTAALLCTAGIRPAVAQIQVEVNGKPVQFGAVHPARIQGRVLIPLRAVVEALGAEVRWDAATQTVNGRKGERTFSLGIGSQSAQVDGMPVRLDVPAQLLSGTTMVPLRFVAEALGAEVEWNAAAQRVLVSAAAGEPVPDPDAPAGADRIEGEVVSVRPGARPPTITIRANGVRSTYEIDEEAIILRSRDGRRGRTVGLDELEEGDLVRIRLSRAGRAEVVDARTPRPIVEPEPEPQPRPQPQPGARVTGEILAVRPAANPPTITLRIDGQRHTFELDRNTLITRGPEGQQGQRVDLDDLKVGDRASLRVDRRTGVADLVEAVLPRGADPRPRPDAGRVTGEVIAVRPNGNPPTITVRVGANRETYDVTRDTLIFRAVGQNKGVRASLDELEIGDRVQIRLDDSGAVATVVEATAVAAPEPNLPVPDANLRISAINLEAPETLREGSVVRVTVRGNPKAQVTFDAGNLAKDVPLRENPQRPGTYEGSFTVPKGVTARDVPVIAQLKIGNRTAPLVQSGTSLTVDSEPPVLTGAAPADRSETVTQQPDIYVELGDGNGTGVDPDSVQVSVRGRDVTRDVKVTPRFLLYTPREALPPGPVPVEVTAKDRAGNETRLAWSFTVKPASAAVQSVTHDADKPLRAGDVITVTVKAQPRGQGTFSIGDEIVDRPLREEEPGVYVGRYTVRRGDQLVKAPVSVRFTARDGSRVRVEATQPVSLLTREPAAPKILEPADRIRLGEELVVAGTGEPGASILIEVNYEGRAFGALAINGTFGSQEVTVDRDGRWETRPFAVRLPLGVRRPTLTITATPVDAAGEKGEPVTATVQTR